jgi:hypothetical protein
MFYSPPSHDRPRDPEGWELTGLYEWTRDKLAAVANKAEDVRLGRRERSLTASPEPYSNTSRASTPEKVSRSNGRYYTHGQVVKICLFIYRLP